MLVKEKRRLRRQYSQAHDLLVKTRINPIRTGLFESVKSEGGMFSTPLVKFYPDNLVQ